MIIFDVSDMEEKVSVDEIPEPLASVEPEQLPKEIFGYTFKNPAFLATALTTPAYRMMFPDSEDNQRLEFHGDAVLGLLAADALYRECPDTPEGGLTVRRCHMVSTGALCAAAQRLNLAPLLRRNKGAKELRPNSHTLADAVEAIIGAAWLDGGLEAARTIFDALGVKANAESGDWSVNPKEAFAGTASQLPPGLLDAFHRRLFARTAFHRSRGSQRGRMRRRFGTFAQGSGSRRRRKTPGENEE